MADLPVINREAKEPSYLDAVIPLVTLIVLIAGSVFLFRMRAVRRSRSASPQARRDSGRCTHGNCGRRR
jgi:hypothetical protein